MMEKRSLGRYELGPRISAGGMGTVHRGMLRGTSGFARPVAIKTLHPHLRDDEAAVRRFLREARLGACVRHANVVPILDVDVDVEPYLVMELVDGSSVATVLRKGVTLGRYMPVSVAAAIACDVLSGLQAIHDASDERGQRLGLVHLDISPQNVIVGRDGIARIVDFGIARALELNPITVDAGKIRYIAPEQFDGEPSARSDIYSAAIVLWEMLTNASYRNGQTRDPRSTGELPPSLARPGLSDALDALVLRALRFDPAKRFSKPDEMRAALEGATVRATAAEVAAWVASLAVEDRESEPSPLAATITVATMTKAPQPRRARLSAFAVASVALVLGFGLSFWSLSGRHVVKVADAKADMRERPEPNAPATQAIAPTEDARAVELTPPATTTVPVAPSSNAPLPRKKATATTKTRPPRCASPYVLLPDGRKHFRLECVE